MRGSEHDGFPGEHRLVPFTMGWTQHSGSLGDQQNSPDSAWCQTASGNIKFSTEEHEQKSKW